MHTAYGRSGTYDEHAGHRMTFGQFFDTKKDGDGTHGFGLRVRAENAPRGVEFDLFLRKFEFYGVDQIVVRSGAARNARRHSAGSEVFSAPSALYGVLALVMI